jgi:hypothetical protein
MAVAVNGGAVTTAADLRALVRGAVETSPLD